MTSTTFFIVFIPILAIILLAINLILAPHNSYQEKDNVFECGFDSFLGQNRMQFNISFFLFAILFLIFDLEILLLFPLFISLYSTGIFGFSVSLFFLLALCAGLVYEIFKGALSINSKQTVLAFNTVIPQPHVFLSILLKSSPPTSLIIPMIGIPA
jgi:NADH-ubiquinone oxidoreductase chain 3